MIFNSKIAAAFRATVAAKLCVADPSAPNEKLLAALDDKIKNRSAARDDELCIEDRRLFEQAWPDQQAGHHVDLGSDDQLYAKAWGSTETGGR